MAVAKHTRLTFRRERGDARRRPGHGFSVGPVFWGRRLPLRSPRFIDGRGQVLVLLGDRPERHLLHDGELRPAPRDDGDDDAQDLLRALRYCVAGLRPERDAVVGRRGGVARRARRAAGAVRPAAACSFQVAVAYVF